MLLSVTWMLFLLCLVSVWTDGLNGAERIECSVTPGHSGRTGALGIEVGTQSTRRPQTELAYVAVPHYHHHQPPTRSKE